MKMSCADFSHPADYEREAVLAHQLFRKERQGYQIEKRFLHRTGMIVWAKVNITLLRESAGGPCLILGIVEDITSQKSAIEKLATSEMEVQSLASRLITSQETERQRIARELHDDIGQRLSMVTSELHALNGARATRGGARTIRIQKLSEELDSLVTDLHGLSHRLHSSKLQHLGVKPALRELCTLLARSGLHVDLTVGEELEPVPEEIALCIYRIAQEALNNTLKHSRGNHAVINLSKTDAEYHMMIKDDGVGFDTEAHSQGLGLISMKERLSPFKGHIAVKSIAGQGTEIVVGIPLRQPPDSISPTELNYDVA
jgi:signal transduction histidine kinase